MRSRLSVEPNAQQCPLPLKRRVGWMCVTRLRHGANSLAPFAGPHPRERGERERICHTPQRETLAGRDRPPISRALTCPSQADTVRAPEATPVMKEHQHVEWKESW